MNLNKQQRTLWDNLNNIFNVLVSLNTPEESFHASIAKFIADFEAITPARVVVKLGESPKLSLLDSTYDNAKTTRDSRGYLNLRARIYGTRLTAVVASRDEVVDNETIVAGLRELANLIEKLPTEISASDALDLFAVLGLKGGSSQEDDAVDPAPAAPATIVADVAPQEVSAEPAAVVVEAAVADQAPVDVVAETPVAEVVTEATPVEVVPESEAATEAVTKAVGPEQEPGVLLLVSISDTDAEAHLA